MNIKTISRTNHCLNCETILDENKDNFCPNCGQLNNTKKETAITLVRELVEEFLHLDSKVTRSLVPLLFKPGNLTVNYLEGKRARYFHPVRLFLTVTVIMFLVQGIFGVDEKKSSKEKTIGEAADSTTKKNSAIEYNFDEFKFGKTDVDSMIKDTIGGKDKRIFTSKNTTINLGSQAIDVDKVTELVKFGVSEPDVMCDSLKIEKSILNKFVVGQVMKGSGSSLEEIKEYYKHKLPWIIFALMPVFAFIMYLIYVRRKYYFVEHLIYAFHLHTATFLIISIANIFNFLSLETLSNICSLYIPFYYFVSLKKVYKQSWLRTTFKGFLIGFLYTFLGIMSIVLISLMLFVVY